MPALVYMCMTESLAKGESCGVHHETPNAAAACCRRHNRRPGVKPRRVMGYDFTYGPRELTEDERHQLSALTVDRSCFTCAHNNPANAGCTPYAQGVPGVSEYVIESGARVSGMPRNREIDCPGWAKKEEG